MIARWFVHEGTIETWTGAGAKGDVFATPVLVHGYLSNSLRVIRETFGEQVVANAMFYTSLSNAGLFTPDSKFTVGGSVSRVVKVNANDTGGLMPNVEHVAVALV